MSLLKIFHGKTLELEGNLTTNSKSFLTEFLLILENFCVIIIILVQDIFGTFRVHRKNLAF